jgi:RNA polymerase sigma-70 factor (ECF subfamily)
VLRSCSRLAGPKVDAEDAAHDAVITILRRLPDLRDPDAFPAWAYGIVRRTIAGHRRKAWVQRWIPGVRTLEEVEGGPDPGHQRELSERAAGVQAVLEMLSAKQREVLILCDVEELTDEEAAALLGIPIGTAKSRLAAARERFATLARHRHLDDPTPGDA